MKTVLQLYKFTIVLLLCFLTFQNFNAQCSVSVLPSLTNNLCLGSSVQLIVEADSGSTFQWSPANDLSNTNNDSVVVTPSFAGDITYLIVATDTSGCIDSVNVSVIANSATTGFVSATSCNSYTLNGQAYTTSGSYTQNLMNAAGCDSTLTLNLTINASNTGTDLQTACDNYTWIDGNTYTSSNTTATYTLSNSAGCDSVVTLNLTLNYSNTGIDVQTACDNYTWIDGNTYTSSNTTATHTLSNSAGCDSVVTLNLTILNSTVGVDVQTACNSYIWIDGNTYTSSNSTANHTLTNSVGCDSVVTLNLTVNYDNTGIDTQVACNSYSWIDGNTYNSSNNTATHTLSNVYGCDSVVTLNLTVNYSNSGTDTQTVCDSLLWIDGNTYTSNNNTATHTLSNIYGCDSVVTLNLTVLYSTTSSMTVTNCDNYTLNGQTYTTTGTYVQNLTNVVGCDSAITLNLFINYSNSSLTTMTVCDSVIWNSQIYTVSGNYTFLTTNADGCDSTANLNLTVNYLDTAYINQTACDDYTLNSQTFNTSGTYIQNLNTVNGCDSTINLNLIVNYSTASSITDTACDSYILNNQTYTTSGTYAQILTNSVNCDSVITLDIIINNSNTSLTPQTVCDSSTWNGTNYATSGVYSYLTLNSVGCDSTAYLDLTVNYSTISSSNILECHNYLWNGNTYNSNGVYTYSTTNAVGCDSTASLNLTIYEPFLPGTIGGQDTLCKYTAPVGLFQASVPEGGDSTYSYQWLSSLDGNNWNTISGATNSSYQPVVLLENNYYTLAVNNLCGIDTTNVLFDSILPSPVIIDIQGDSVFCANQHDNFFWLNEILPNINYDWQITGGSIFQQISDSALAVDMDDFSGDIIVQLLMTHNQTLCEVLVDKIVITTDNSSPNRTQVIRKPNSDILVCDDSTVNLIYQWGFTEKSSGTDTDIVGANLRYVLLPHTFDSTIYRYWVRTSFDYGSGESCETLSYLGSSPITGDELFYENSDLKPYPNPSNGIFNLPYKGIQSATLIDNLGRLTPILVNDRDGTNTINLSNFPEGLYFIKIKLHNQSISIPLFKIKP
jgi:hypothetical protein